MPIADSQFPPFPKEIIRGLASEFVEIYEPIRETSPQALWLSFVCNLGCMVSPYVRLNADSSEPRFFGVIVGRSARTRKSTALNAAADVFKGKPFSDYIRTIRGFGSSEGLMSALGVEAHPFPAIVHLDEINVLARKTQMDGSTGISAFNTLYEEHDYDHPLARDNRKIRNAYLALLGASTIDDFLKTWKGQHQDAGFLNRLLIVGVDEPDKSIPIPVDPNPEVIEALRQRILELYGDVHRTPRIYALSPDAEKLWADFYAQRGSSVEWDRIDTYGLRLMAVQTLLEGDQAVSKVTVERIIEFLRYEVMVRSVATPIIAENSIAEMEQLIQAKLGAATSGVTKRDLQWMTNAHRKGIEIFNRAIKNLAGEGLIESQQKGRSMIYWLAPPEDANNAIAGVIRESDDNQGQDKHLCIQ